MWNTISNSILFYSEDFYNNSIYKNRQFIKRLYFYYKNKGFKNIIFTQLINIFTTIFLFILILFLFNSINYSKLFQVSQNEKLSKFIKIHRLFKLNTFLICLFISFCIFIVTKILNLIELIYIYSKIKIFYNKTLKINDEEIKYIKWSKVINKYEEHNNEDINIYEINSIILFYENYLNYLFSDKIIKLNHLTNLMEWNIEYCILIKIFDKETAEIPLIEKKRQIFNRIRTVAICNFIFMPFILIFMLFYNIFNYGEEFYNQPSQLTNRIFTKQALWKYRYYNELPHEFNKRLQLVIKDCNSYINQFKNEYITFISKLVIFVLSSFFVILLSLSLMNDKILIYLTVLSNKSVFWIMGIFASVITILKTNNLASEEPKYYMKQISKNLYISNDFVNNSNLIENKNDFINDYQYKINILFKDIVYTILTPFRLWILANNTDEIIYYINKNISKNELKNCIKSDFNTQIFNNYINSDYEINKTYKSLEIFNETYYEWYKYMSKKINGLTNEVKINII